MARDLSVVWVWYVCFVAFACNSVKAGAVSVNEKRECVGVGVESVRTLVKRDPVGLDECFRSAGVKRRIYSSSLYSLSNSPSSHGPGVVI